MDNKPIIEKTFEVNAELYGDGCRLFQKKFVFPKNYVITALFAAALVYDIICFVMDTANAMYIVAAFICVVIAVSPWKQAYNSRKKLMDAVKDHEHDTYSIKLFDGYMTVEMLDNPKEENPSANSIVKTENGEFDSEFFAPPAEDVPNTAKVEFNSYTKIAENEKMFLVYVVRSVFYVLPKSAFSDEEIKIIQEYFANHKSK